MEADQVYTAPLKGKKTRRVMELLGDLHLLGLERLRLAAFWDDGPAPFWRGFITPVTNIRRDHGGIISSADGAAVFSSRHFSVPNAPWPHMLEQSVRESAETFIELYPEVAGSGRGNDREYVEWYAAMLRATAPTGLVAAYVYWEPPPSHMLVSCGPKDVTIGLPPPGEA